MYVHYKGRKIENKVMLVERTFKDTFEYNV